MLHSVIYFPSCPVCRRSPLTAISVTNEGCESSSTVASRSKYMTSIYANVFWLSGVFYCLSASFSGETRAGWCVVSWYLWILSRSIVDTRISSQQDSFKYINPRITTSVFLFLSFICWIFCQTTETGSWIWKIFGHQSCFWWRNNQDVCRTCVCLWMWLSNGTSATTGPGDIRIDSFPSLLSVPFFPSQHRPCLLTMFKSFSEDRLTAAGLCF